MTHHPYVHILHPGPRHRDPPSTSSSSSSSFSHRPSQQSYTNELSSLLTSPSSNRLEPTFVLPTRITTIHPQLRDLLVCPVKRGGVFYVKSRGVAELRVEVGRRGRRRGAGAESDSARVGEGEEEGNVAPKFKTSTLSSLKFTPNCLAATPIMLAAGGQFGEVHLTSLPPHHPSHGSSEPWSLTLTLPRTSINNSFLLLPPHRDERCRASPLPTRESSPCGGADERDRDGRGHREDNYAAARGGQMMTRGLGIATGPNTLPASSGRYRDRRSPPFSGDERHRSVVEESFNPIGVSEPGHVYFSPPVPRSTSTRLTSTGMRREPGRRLNNGRVEYDDPLFGRIGLTLRPRVADGNGSDGTGEEHGRPEGSMIQMTHSLSEEIGGDEMDAMDWDLDPEIDWSRDGEGDDLDPGEYSWMTTIGREGGGPSVSWEEIEAEERRAERELGRESFARHGDGSLYSPEDIRRRSSFGWSDDPADRHYWTTDGRLSRSVSQSAPTNRSVQRRRMPVVVTTSDPDPSRRSSPASTGGRVLEQTSRSSSTTLVGPYDRTDRSRCGSIGWEPRLLVSNNNMSVKMFAIRSGAGGTLPGLSDPSPFQRSPRDYHVLPADDDKIARGHRLRMIGCTRLDTPVNHSSISPDGRQMLVVGDSTTMYVYNVLGGGKEFRKVAEYKGSNDAGFSSSWSKDGRKFALASQDGQVTVWDHRSSHPLAKLFTTPISSRSSPSFAGDLTTYWDMLDAGGYVDNYGGNPSSGGVRRDPARVVKFSPVGSDRDILVFSEEHDNIHVVDARTFDAVLTLPVPYEVPLAGSNAVPLPAERARRGMDGGRIGIAGLCFDPTGNFVYSGTESTIVEWDLRSDRKRGRGSTAIA